MQKFGGREEKQGEGHIPSRRKSVCTELDTQRVRKNRLELDSKDRETIRPHS